ncbi:MAG: pilus assembly PilX N-terminal domain-containing protein, partial [Candidatus Peregrinibacteria bacterium]|nr:pilus assembly PilX N-terminal domain-containing protein [Candidatus Peregrinibacteria bacterium]
MPIVCVKTRRVFGEILLKKGSALLTSLLVMGVLMSVSLALSALVLREIYTTREVLDAGRAYYGAESGVEVALYKIKHNLPGWETAKKGFESLKIDNEENVVTEYKVDNTCNAYPCFGNDFEKTNVDLTAFYDILDLNESITIPLFVVGNDRKEHRVKDFTVEFYGIFDPNTDLKVKSNNFRLSGWDILRWKILGISAENKTESVSDFTALSTWTQGENGTGKKNATDATNPSWFGSVSCEASEN